MNQRTWHPIAVVFLRQMLSSRTLWRQFIIMRLVEPMIFFYGIGLGFGALIPQLAGHDYKTFLLPGSICLALMFGSLLDGSYSAYVRAFTQRTWISFIATPTRVIDIMVGEMAWTGLKSILSASLMMVAGIVLGAKVSFIGFLLAIPVALLLSMSLMAIGYIATGLVRDMNDFDMVWAFVMTPMMVFSGVMVDIRIFPEWLQILTQFLPLTHGIAAIRGLMLGEIGLLGVLWHMLVLAGICVAATWYSHRLLKRKLVD